MTQNNNLGLRSKPTETELTSVGFSRFDGSVQLNLSVKSKSRFNWWFNRSVRLTEPCILLLHIAREQ